jgi:serine/threonine-protein kinase HipA
VKELQVTFHGLSAPFLLGSLADDGQDVLFQYTPQAIDRGLELSPIRLPLRAQAYPDRRGDYAKLHDVPGLIYDSLPDGWGYRLMHRRMKARGIDPGQASILDRLAFLGENTMGALTYAPALLDAQDSRDLTLIELAQEVQAVLTDESHQVLAELARAGGSPGGARPKALVYFNPATGQMSTQANQVHDAQAWMVKFPGVDDEPDCCALEELYARVAHHCELGMTPTRFFELSGGRTAFGTQRFDRRGSQRIHVHSLAGLLHANFQEPSVSYEDFFRLTRRLTRDQRQLKKAVQRCVFNVLMNNRDDHAKNLAFMLDSDGNWQLAPPFDLTYCPGYQGEHFMDVAGEGKTPTRQHVLNAAQGAGLPLAVAADAIDEVLSLATPDRLLALAQDLPLRAATVGTVHRAVKAHHARLAR